MRKTKLTLLIAAALILIGNAVFAQGTLKGTIKDATTKEALIGATIKVEGTSLGTVTNLDGVFSLDVPAGQKTLAITYVGYDKMMKDVSVVDGQTLDLGTIKLEASAIGLAGIRIVADRAKERETPVAFTNLEKKQIEEQLGSQDIPLVLNTTPSVYSTMQGGGAGDARINVRGFDQRNVAIMINGVPVNDMENGWVYWSNWDGVGDATSSIQIQRGLSAVNLATPSIGGTMNIITNPAEQKAGVSYKQEFGSGNFMKSTLFAHTGLIDGKFAFSAGGVRKTGDGIIDGAWTDAWAYYFGASWNINKNNRLELYAIGAPQRHGQNLYKQNMGVYSAEYAKDQDDYDQAALEKFPEANSGQLYNQNWSFVDYNYFGSQYWNGNKHSRYSQDIINERENYYHKPQVNLNWYHQYNKDLSQYTILYYSGGTGGGSGTYGSVKYNYSLEPTRIVDYNATIAQNMESDTAKGILRNSTNNQNTVGLISKLTYNVNENLKTQIGLDLRTAKIEHFREVRDLLGGKFFYFDGNEFENAEEYNKTLGGKVDYFNTNTVNWGGLSAQAEYTKDNLTLYGMLGYSMIKYGYTDEFRRESAGSEDAFNSKSDWISGLQIKGGASYNFTETFNAFVNAGYVSKVPIFDNVINDWNGVVNEDPETEKFIALEGGIQFTPTSNVFDVKLNGYYTTWTDRAKTLGVVDAQGNDDLVTLTGMDQRHIGVELEAAYQPAEFVRIDLSASTGNWIYTDDVNGLYDDYDENGQLEQKEYNYYVKDLKVGDAPQTQFAASLTLYPIKDFRAQLTGRYYTNYYSAWDPFSRTDPDDTEQVWEIPSFTVFDLHLNYKLPIDLNGMSMNVFAHVFNLFDELYVQDATDNSAYNGFDGDHDADDAEVYMGLPRYTNFGFQLKF